MSVSYIPVFVVGHMVESITTGERYTVTELLDGMATKARAIHMRTGNSVVINDNWHGYASRGQAV